MIFFLQLDSPISPETDFYLSDIKEKQLKGPTESLKDVYRELLQQQSIIRQNMKEQLGQEPPSSAPQLPGIWLHDTGGELQELEDLLSETAASPLLSPPSDSERSQSDGLVLGMNLENIATDIQNQLDTEHRQLFPTSEAQINSFSGWALEEPAKGEDSLLKQVTPDQAALRKLSQEVELLTSQNEALNQRNQEMLNQLTEADREIERLKAELSSRYIEPHHLPEVEQQGETRVEDLEKELSLRNQEFQEAQTLITSLEEKLRATEELLHLSDSVEENKSKAEKQEGYLLRCFEATEAKLTELDRQLNQSELTCRELQEAEKLYRQRAAEAEADIRRLNEELEKERLKGGEGSVSSEEKSQKVIEGMTVRLTALGRLLELIDRLDRESEEEEESPAVVSQLKWEEEFWSLLLNKLKEDASQRTDPADVLVSEVAEQMMLEKRMLLVGCRLLQSEGVAWEGWEGRRESEDVNGVHTVWNNVAASETPETEEKGVFDSCDFEHFKAVTQMKISLLNQLASSLSTTAAHSELQPAADRLYHFYFSDRPWVVSSVHSAATEALYRCLLRRLCSKYANCRDCVKLREENWELKVKLSNLEEQQASKMNACCQTDEMYPQKTEQQSAEETQEEEVALNDEMDEMEIPQKASDENLRESDEADGNMESVSALRVKVEELEEQLTAMVDKISSVQMQHEKVIEKLKVGAACICFHAEDLTLCYEHGVRPV